MLQRAGVELQGKPFAVGLRVEHPATLINRIQYGLARIRACPPPNTPWPGTIPETGRGVYSFCMCPGGEVVLSSSEAGGVVVNGMSFLRRAGEWSNSALVVSVGPDDFTEFGGSDPLAGVRFQRHWEAAAFAAAGGDYRAPAQNLLAFLGRGNGPVQSTCRPGIREAELDTRPAGLRQRGAAPGAAPFRAADARFHYRRGDPDRGRNPHLGAPAHRPRGERPVPSPIPDSIRPAKGPAMPAAS